MNEMFEILKLLDKWYDEFKIDLDGYFRMKHDIVSVYQKKYEEGEKNV